MINSALQLALGAHVHGSEGGGKGKMGTGGRGNLEEGLGGVITDI